MNTKKIDIINQLKKDILFLQGFKRLPTDANVQIKLGPIDTAFPDGCFPLASIHEFVSDRPEHTAATDGFIASLLAILLQNSGICVWISSSRTVFPPAFKGFGIEPDKIIFIEIKNQTDILWVIEEALKCDGLAAVVGEIPQINFTTSRRFQLAVEKSRVTGFMIGNQPRNLNVNACLSRWKITPIPSVLPDEMPGVGFTCWNIELLKIRNGRPGVWQLKWINGKFEPVYKPVEMISELQKKTG